MVSARQFVLGVLLALFAFIGTGCNLMPHNLKPWRLWRLNRMPAPSRAVNFSVSDPIPIAQQDLPDRKTADRPD